MYKHILLAADGSDHSYRAAKQAGNLAKMSSDCIITMLYIINYDDSKKAVLHQDSLVAAQRERRDKLKRHELLFKQKGIRYSVMLKHGEPGPTIVKYANEEKVDLVILGSRGLNNLQQFVLGSVSHKVVKRVNCPVMIVK
ncbi:MULTISPECIES: universal stress protein [Bacillaceae]|uniref:Universal stress protein n=1 Tax=Domibacillus aminovorans TaxID=29332 RepID=A0A177KHH8_9BACI|nr:MULTISPECIES: universal stress protein [Bacillaceae]OAH52840.1 universal stress protein [Domibacillus aminovorans]